MWHHLIHAVTYATIGFLMAYHFVGDEIVKLLLYDALAACAFSEFALRFWGKK